MREETDAIIELIQSFPRLGIIVTEVPGFTTKPHVFGGAGEGGGTTKLLMQQLAQYELTEEELQDINKN